MFIPIVMTLDPAGELSWMWVFHKLALLGSGYNWPVVAQKEYFEHYENFIMPEVMKELFDVSLEKTGVLENITPIEIPEAIITQYISKFPSQTDAYLKSFTDQWDELVDYLYNKINEVVAKTNRTIDGLILFKYYKCFDTLAEKLHVPTFYFELGALRYPDYRNTFYWSTKGLFGKAALDERFEKFCNESMETAPIILKPKEILALFLNVDKLSYLKSENSKQYEFGIMGGYSVPSPGSAFNGITLAEQITRVSKICNKEEILVKTHPGDPLLASPRLPHIESPGVTAAQFFQKCKRVVCAGSNAPYEAALYGVPSYDLGASQYAFISNLSLDLLHDSIPSDDALSFIAFACLAPLEFLKDIEYIKWLLSKPQESEIYKYNLEYYLNEYGLQYEDLEKAENRLDYIVQSRLHGDKEYVKYLPLGCLTPMAQLELELKATKNQLQRKQEITIESIKENKQITEQLEQLRQENSLLQKNLEEYKDKIAYMSADEEKLRGFQETVQKEIGILKESVSIMDHIKLRNIELEKELQLIHHLYQEVIQSTSYKCTKPLRVMADFIKNLR